MKTPSLVALPLTILALLASPSLASAQEAETWRGLTVESEDRCSVYDADHYPYPQSVELDVIESMGGRIYGPYTGRTFTHRGETDIEHIIARSEAHDSGLCSTDAETRELFATDLLNLTLASPEINRCNPGGKCGYDAAEWEPERNSCWFAARIVAVRQKYELTIDRSEVEKLEDILGNCESTEMVFYESDEL